MPTFNPPLEKADYLDLSKKQKRAFARYLKKKQVPHHPKNIKSMQSAWKLLKQNTKIQEQEKEEAAVRVSEQIKANTVKPKGHYDNNSPKRFEMEKKAWLSILWLRIKQFLRI